MNRRGMFIQAAGAVTALGLDAPTTVASLRAGLQAFQLVPFWGESEEDLQAAPIRGFAEGIDGIARYGALAALAIEPCLDGLSSVERLQALLCLGLPNPARPGVPPGLSAQLPALLAARLRLGPQQIRVVELGRASVFESLRLYQSQMERGSLVVGGVDVLVNALSLRGLSEQGLLKEESDGFIPGEAAAFVRLGSTSCPGFWSSVGAAILGVGTAIETADGSAENPLTGVALRCAFRAALQEAGVHEEEVFLCLNDVNGTRAAFEDQGMGHVRFFRTPREHLEIWHIASSLGEVGAAVGALEIIWAAAALELGLSPGNGALLSVAEGSHRGAVYVCHLDRQGTARWPVSIEGPALHPPLPRLPEPIDPGLPIQQSSGLTQELRVRHVDELAWLLEVRAKHLEDDDPWQSIASYEERLVAHLDALAWLSADKRDLVQLTEEADRPSAALLLCLLTHPAGPAHLEHVEPGWPGSEAADQVLPLLPHEVVGPLLGRQAGSADPQRAAWAVYNLAVAGCLTSAALESFWVRCRHQPEPKAMSMAIQAMAIARICPSDAALHSLLAEQAAELDETGHCAVLALLPRGSLPRGYSIPALCMRAPLAAAFACMREQRSLLAHLDPGARFTPAQLEALGWAGETAASGILLSALESEDEALGAAAARALYRIYGSELWEKKEVLHADGEKMRVRRLSREPARWQRATASHAPGLRLRHGEAWSGTPLRHLQHRGSGYKERCRALWEFAILQERPWFLHPIWFVKRQRSALSALHPG